MINSDHQQAIELMLASGDHDQLLLFCQQALAVHPEVTDYREAQLFVGWVSGSVTHAGVGFHSSTQPTFILYLIPPTYLSAARAASNSARNLVILAVRIRVQSGFNCAAQKRDN
ncbi:MAG: hypothetical protein EWV40_13145 [Microcystis flos-aquae Mf_WU_F_19750830_S460]|uniref:Uncharacterized protein n=1 Tax=Microcystis flos-aquae Mf_WU_F_19750830_S460 TaxID=2486237 RepID=A0A552LKE7_9CHRO|nr:MAG: hypothetical protein EWV40_13145 [Microcystis flos-aquae Mf_WU_F_19750830_S460]